MPKAWTCAFVQALRQAQGTASPLIHTDAAHPWPCNARKMPSNGPHSPSVPLAVPRLYLPIADGTEPALRRSEPFAILLH